MKTVKRILYKSLPLERYLRVLSVGFFVGFRLGVFRRTKAYEYVSFLKKLVGEGDVAIDLGANLGYYSRTLSHLVGDEGKVYAVEPVPPVLSVLRYNLRRKRNVEILPFALGERDGSVTMVNDCADGYMGSGRNRVSDESAELTFTVEMRRGSEIFGGLERIDFVKCDVEGYELAVLTEMAGVIEHHRPTCLVESGGANRRRVIELFRTMGYAGYVLQKGELVSVMHAKGEKDIVFIASTDRL